MLKRRHFNYIIIFVLLLLSLPVLWYFYKNYTSKFKCVQTNEIVWFARQFDCSNSSCTDNMKDWNDAAFKVLKNEWKDTKTLIKTNLKIKNWIPLNVYDSEKLETTWKKLNDHYENCPAHEAGNFNEECKASKESLMRDKNNEIAVMNNLYRAYLFFNKNHGYLLPIYWKGEKKIWMIWRADILYELSQPPHMSYFYEILPNSEMQYFYQPVLESKYCSKKDLPMIQNFNADRINKSYSHLIFVVHGIGHRKGEESIVQNAYDVRNGFAKYLKKFQPHIDMPMVIPIAWRHNLTLNDEIIWSLSLINEKNVNDIGLIVNDILYYLKGFNKLIIQKFIDEINSKYIQFMKRNPNFIGNISILAHSLGTVITFDALNEYENKFNSDFIKKLENLFFIGSPISRFIASDAVCKKVGNLNDDSINALLEFFEKKKFDDDLLRHKLHLFKDIIKETMKNSETINCSGIDPNELRQNPWIKKGRLFNILHSDDPIAHRLEILFDNNYTFIDPFPLSLHKAFHRSFWNASTVSEEEEIELAKFHYRFDSDRANASSHNGFLKYEYEKETLKFQALPTNFPSIKNTLNNLWIFITELDWKEPWTIPMAILQAIFEFFTNLLNDFERIFEFVTERIEKKVILENSKETIKIDEKRLLHRLDYDLKEIEPHPKYNDSGNLFSTEKKFINWATEVIFTHMSYWKRPEITFLMANVIYGYSSTTTKELSSATSEFDANVPSYRRTMIYIGIFIMAIISAFIVKWLLPPNTSLIEFKNTLNLYQEDTWRNDFLLLKYYFIESLSYVTGLIRLCLKIFMVVVFWAVILCCPLIPFIMDIVFEAFKLTSFQKFCIYSIFFLPPLLNLMIWETHLNRDTWRRFIRYVLYTTTFIIFLAGLLCYFSEAYRQFETKCRNPTADGKRCIKYEMIKIDEALNFMDKMMDGFTEKTGIGKWFMSWRNYLKNNF